MHKVHAAQGAIEFRFNPRPALRPGDAWICVAHGGFAGVSIRARP